MSKKLSDVKILHQSEINKKIIAHVPKFRPVEDLLGPLDKYNDELHESYNLKKKQFYDLGKKYKRLNQQTLLSSKPMLHDDYMEQIKMDICGVPNEEETNKVFDEKQTVCSLEPWLKRYLILNKFIWAARTIILRNRLLNVLDHLKQLDALKVKEYEQRPKMKNVSYADIFDKFI